MAIYIAKLTFLAVFYCIPYVLLFFFKTFISPPLSHQTSAIRHRCIQDISLTHTKRIKGHIF